MLTLPAKIGISAPGSWVVRTPVVPHIIGVNELPRLRNSQRWIMPFDTFRILHPQKNEHWRKVPQKKTTRIIRKFSSCRHLFVAIGFFSTGESFFFPSNPRLPLHHAPWKTIEMPSVTYGPQAQQKRCQASCCSKWGLNGDETNHWEYMGI